MRLEKNLQKVLALLLVLAVAGGLVCWLVTGDAHVDSGKTANNADAKLRFRASKKPLPPARARELLRRESQGVRLAPASPESLITREQLRREFGDDYRRLTNDIIDELLKLTAERRDLFRRIFKASDPPNLKALVNLMQEAMHCDSPTIRSAIVGGLAGVGIDGMDALSEFLLDSDPDVAQQALNEFDTLLSEVEDEKAKIALCEKTMTFLKDEEAIRYIAVDLNGCEDQAAAVEALVRIIGGTNAKAAEIAKESYEFITDEEYTSSETAKKWIEDHKTDVQDSEPAKTE